MKQSLPAKECIFTILAILLVFFLPHLGLIPLPFGYAIVITVGIWLYLKRTGETFSDLGLRFKRFEWKAVLTGAVTAIAAFIFLQYAFFPLLQKMVPLKKANLDDFKQVRHHTASYIFFILLSFIAGGFYEELAFHGFIFTRLEKILPAKNKVTIAFLLTNAIFALYHFQLGTAGMLNALLAGCIYHALVIKYNRNLWYSFFAHGFFDSIAFTYIYLGYW